MNISLQEKLVKCKEKNIEEIDINEIDNIDDIVVDTSKSKDERIIEFLENIKNPYFFNIDGCIVKFSFSESNITADECTENVMKHFLIK